MRSEASGCILWGSWGMCHCLLTSSGDSLYTAGSYMLAHVEQPLWLLWYWEENPDARREDGLWVFGSVASLRRSLCISVIMTGESTHTSALKQWSWRRGFAQGTDTEIVKNWIWVLALPVAGPKPLGKLGTDPQFPLHGPLFTVMPRARMWMQVHVWCM